MEVWFVLEEKRVRLNPVDVKMRVQEIRNLIYSALDLLAERNMKLEAATRLEEAAMILRSLMRYRREFPRGRFEEEER